MSQLDSIIPLYGSPGKTIAKSSGSYVFDSDGKRYIDFESGVWASNLGHNNREINNALKKAMKETFHHGYRFKNPEASLLSAKLLNLSHLDKGQSTFLSSGSEAVNLGILIARNISGRNKILKINTSFLSAYGYGRLSVDNNDKVDVAFDDIRGLDELDFSDIATAVLEVGCASLEGIRFPSSDFVDTLYRLCRLNKCYLIANEVTTGFGRTGKMFGYMHYDVKPDIVVMGKGLGNGYPVSAVLINEEVATKFSDHPFRYAQSHQNDPSGCKVGNAVVDYFEKYNILSKSEIAGRYFKSKLEELRSEKPNKIKEVRGKGLMIAFEMSSEIEAQKLCLDLFNAGFIVGNKGASIRLMPPLVISNKDIDALVDEIRRVA